MKDGAGTRPLLWWSVKLVEAGARWKLVCHSAWSLRHTEGELGRAAFHSVPPASKLQHSATNEPRTNS